MRKHERKIPKTTAAFYKKLLDEHGFTYQEIPEDAEHTNIILHFETDMELLTMGILLARAEDVERLSN